MQNQKVVLEIEKIAKIKKMVNIGVRLNPDTDAKTLSQISTGKKINLAYQKKFFEFNKLF